MFIYLTFYFLYIPKISHTRNINFQFDSRCQDECLNPYAEVALHDYKTPSIFARGQSYQFTVDMDVPESDVNWSQGMFMVRLKLMDEKEQVLLNTASPSILYYKSPILRIINIICYWPWLVTGFTGESQRLTVPLMNEYSDSPQPGHGSASKAMIYLEARQIQIYSAVLNIKANLKGLRYMMVNWPITSALFGTLSIGSFLSIITLLSVYRALSNQGNDIIADDQRQQPSLHIKGNELTDPNSGLSGNIDSEACSKLGEDDGPDSTNPI